MSRKNHCYSKPVVILSKSTVVRYGYLLPHQRWISLREAERGEECKKHLLHLGLLRFLHLPTRLKFNTSEAIRDRGGTETAGGKEQNRAGATPLFRLSAAQKVRGSLPPCCTLIACCFFFAALSSQTSCNAVRITPWERKRRTHMALLKTPSKKPKTTTLQVRLEEEVKLKLENYAEFIDATPSYVTSEALRLLFRRDGDFKRWLGQHSNDSNADETEGDLLTKTG
jgi:hypothetical protein